MASSFGEFVARHYDLWYPEAVNAAEQAFYKQFIAGSDGTPALEIGCGTGRLLLGWIQDGLDVDGVDYSKDMLAVCTAKASALGLQPALYHQAMQQLDLPRAYKTILIPGNTFNLLTSPADAREALKRMYAHMQDGGQLLITLTLVQDDIQQESPEPVWRKMAEARRSDGAVVQVSEQVTLDHSEQQKTSLYKYELFQDGSLVETYEDTIQVRWYYPDEIEPMLKDAGFRNCEFHYRMTEQGEEDRSSVLVFADW